MMISSPVKISLAEFLDAKVDEYNRPAFIASDPISIPHRFSKKQDIEIAGFFAAVFSWGNRSTIIKKSGELMRLMDNAPHQFVLGHGEKELRKLLAFRHRTFNTTDLLYFIEFLGQHYRRFDSLEDAFLVHQPDESGNLPPSSALHPVREPLTHPALSLSSFCAYFFSLEDAPARTRKHISTPDKKSACKRLNMFLRWMVRKDDRGVDFGLWTRISPSALVCPLDLHVARVARRFGLLTRKATDWQAALELTGQLRKLDKEDPVKYDFALFGLGIMEKY
jgi:uncharacterized protein (TIGR02757 family)